MLLVFLPKAIFSEPIPVDKSFSELNTFVTSVLLVMILFKLAWLPYVSQVPVEANWLTKVALCSKPASAMVRLCSLFMMSVFNNCTTKANVIVIKNNRLPWGNSTLGLFKKDMHLPIMLMADCAVL